MINFSNKIITSEKRSTSTTVLSPISKRISPNLLADFSNLNFSGVYRIGSETSKRDCYIGSAYNITLKITHHVNLLYRGEHHSKGLQDWVNENGIENLDITLLLRTTAFPDDFESKEQYFLDLIKPKFNSVLNKRKVKVELKEFGSLNYCNTKILNEFGNSIVSKHSINAKRHIIRIILNKNINNEEKRLTHPIHYFCMNDERVVINKNPMSIKKTVYVPKIEPIRRKGVFKV